METVEDNKEHQSISQEKNIQQRELITVKSYFLKKTNIVDKLLVRYEKKKWKKMSNTININGDFTIELTYVKNTLIYYEYIYSNV